ncbi:MAG: insulinase family protein [Rikenellaceae bacterium]
MKKIGLLLTFLLLSLGVMAQVELSEKLIPTDTTYTTGKLSNGMSYYIRKNDQPKGLADFYIARSVGAIEEDEHQIGLAHFLEHMAFNGTENLPGKEMLNYLQSIGAEFGRNINAWTGQEETVYMLNDIPISRQPIIDSALLVLYDWSQNISLLPEEVDKERGVIIEELRTGNNANFRISLQTFPYLFNGTKYKDRNVIGNEKGLREFTHDDIVSFYKEWYRPEYQAIIVVGDFDVKAMEKEIIEMFSKVPSPENARKKEKIVIPEYTENQFKAFSDPEITSSYIQYIVPANEVFSEENSYYSSLFEDYMATIIMMAMNERLADIAREENPPYTSANVSYGTLVTTTEAMFGTIGVKEGETAKGLEAVVAQIEKMRNYGITEDEFERNILNLRTSLEAAIKRQDDRKSSEYVDGALQNFTSNTPITSPEQDLMLFDEFVAYTTIDMVNDFVSEVYPDKKGAILAVTPDKEGAKPTEESLKAAFETGKNANLPAPENKVVAQSLINGDIVAGKIVSEKKDIFGNSVLTLSNGATVVLRESDLKKDQILFSGSGFGGTSYIPTENLAAEKLMGAVVNKSGLGELSQSDLQKFLTGKRGWASVYSDSNRSGVSGTSSSSISDIETMLQATYMSFTAPRFDNTAFENVVKQTKNSLLNYDKNPRNIFLDKVLKDEFYGDNPRVIDNFELEQELDNITLDEIEKIYRSTYHGVGGYTFFMVGEFDENEVRPLIEKYIASIPSGEKRELRDAKIDFLKGETVKDFRYKMENPQSLVYIAYSGEGIDYNIKNAVAVALLGEILDLRYTEIIREEKGATYGVSVQGSLNFEPKDVFSLRAAFDTNGDVASEMADIVEQQIEIIADGTILDDDFNKVISARKKNYDVDMKENSRWKSWIENYYTTGENFIEDYINVVGSITKEDVSKVAKTILKNGNMKRLIMYPEGE